MLARLLLREEAYAHDSLRMNYVSNLAMAYERDPGVTHDWNGTLEGQPVQKLFSHAIHSLRKGRGEEGAGVEVSQAPALLHSHLAAVIAYMTLRMRCTQDPYDRIL